MMLIFIYYYFLILWHCHFQCTSLFCSYVFNYLSCSKQPWGNWWTNRCHSHIYVSTTFISTFFPFIIIVHHPYPRVCISWILIDRVDSSKTGSPGDGMIQILWNILPSSESPAWEQWAFFSTSSYHIFHDVIHKLVSWRDGYVDTSDPC